jgi:putative transposase
MTVQPEIVNQLVQGIKTSEELFGQNGLIKTLTKQLIEKMLEAELTHHLGYDKYSSSSQNQSNSRNGKSTKTIKTGTGELEIAVPRDRESSFEPSLMPEDSVQ